MTRDMGEREDMSHEAEQSQQVEERAMGHRKSHSRLRVDRVTALAPCSVANRAAVGPEIRRTHSLSIHPS